MTAAETIAAKIAAQSTPFLCQSFEDTNAMTGTPGVAIVRGAIMDELERRNPEAFLAWMETSDVSVMDYPSVFFC